MSTPSGTAAGLAPLTVHRHPAARIDGRLGPCRGCARPPPGPAGDLRDRIHRRGAPPGAEKRVPAKTLPALGRAVRYRETYGRADEISLRLASRSRSGMSRTAMPQVRCSITALPKGRENKDLFCPVVGKSFDIALWPSYAPAHRRRAVRGGLSFRTRMDQRDENLFAEARRGRQKVGSHRREGPCGG